MISRRLSALTLSLLAFAGCHEDPTVEAVLVQPTTQALTLSAAGGAASSTAGADGVGGAGGSFLVTANGLISLGSPAFIPGVPAIPATPNVTSTPLSTPVATTSSAGSILISGNVTTTATTPVVLTSTNGDIVISGALQSGVLGSVLSDIQLIAPNGTVYVTGTIRTAGDDAAMDGKAGGKLTIDAARVVITGTIDTHGLADNTGASNGGKGGDVDIKASKAPIYFTSGSIVTTGGSAVDMTGGDGGFVHMNSAAPVNAVHVFAPITTNGGAGTGTTPTGGQAGSVVIQGAGEINLLGSLSLQGGAATGTATNAVGGAGGSLSADGPAVCRIYGSLLVTGGAASASTAGGTVTGGAGGAVLLGQAPGGLNSVELGSGTYTQAGGTGGLTIGTGGGAGGTVTVESIDGDITIASSLSVAGGAGIGTGSASGGPAGTIQIRTDAQAASQSNHLLSIASLSSLLDASGGAAQGSGVGGTGGTILLQSGGDLTCGARILASGGTSPLGTGGGTLAGAGLLQVTTANPPATGNLKVTGTIDAAGGVVTTGGTGGNGSDVTARIVSGNGSLTTSATITTTGSNGGVGAGGNSGNILLHSGSGDLVLSGTLTVNGSSSPLTPQVAGNITLESSGVLTSSAALNAVGGASTDPTGAAIAKNGGSILLDGQSAFSSLTLLAGSSLLADGGATTGVSVTTVGGAGGTITMRSLGQNIDMSGSILARGGAGSGTTTGGPGGRVLVVSDFGASGISGNITLESGGLIDVSGGSGSVLGPAVFNPGPPADPDPTVALPATLAVAFDANNGTSATGGTNPGRITNSGSIVATGSTGGDVWWNGLNSLGVALTPADNVGINVTGTVPGHFYPH